MNYATQKNIYLPKGWSAKSTNPLIIPLGEPAYSSWYLTDSNSNKYLRSIFDCKIDKNNLIIHGNSNNLGEFVLNLASTDLPSSRENMLTIVFIVEEGIEISTQELPDYILNDLEQEYSANIQASGGTPPYHYRVVGALPSGMKITQDGHLHGIPDYEIKDHASGAVIPFEFFLGATDAKGHGGHEDDICKINGWKRYSIRVEEEIKITAQAAASAKAVANRDYSITFAASGGASPYKFQVLTAEGKETEAILNSFKIGCPPGLTSHSSGEKITIDGRPTKAGIYTVIIGATDFYDRGGHSNAVNGWGHFEFAVEETPHITISPTNRLLSGTLGQQFKETFSASGGEKPYKYRILDKTGTPPPTEWLTITNDVTGCVISGWPRKAGEYQFYVGATDRYGNGGHDSGMEGWCEYTLNIDHELPPLKPTEEVAIQIGGPANFPNGMVNRAYPAQVIVASGGAGHFTYKSFGSVPQGLAIDPSTGVFDGTPKVVGTFEFWLGATDSSGNGGKDKGMNGWHAKYTLNIKPELIISFSGAADVQVNQEYSGKINATGGTGPYTYKVAGLPSTLACNNDVISGKLSAAVQFIFSITVTDAFGYTAEHFHQLKVTSPSSEELSVSFSEKSQRKVNVAYTGELNVTGGVPPYKIEEKATPPFLTWTEKNETSKVLTGTPKTPGLFDLRIRVTDSSGHSAEKAWELEIASAPEDIENSIFDDPKLFVRGPRGHYSLHASGFAMSPKNTNPIAKFGISWTGHAESDSNRIMWEYATPTSGGGATFNFSTPRAEVKEMLYPVIYAKLKDGTTIGQHFVFPSGEGLFEVATNVAIGDSPLTPPIEVTMTTTGRLNKSSPFPVKAGEKIRVEFRVMPIVGLRRINVHAALEGSQLIKRVGRPVIVEPKDLTQQPQDSNRLLRWNGVDNTQVLALSNVRAERVFTVVFHLEVAAGAGAGAMKFWLSDPESVGTSLVSAFEKDLEYTLQLNAIA